MSGDLNRTTIRLTASADAADAIGQLERAVQLARDLEAVGFRVTLSGDLYLDARMAPKPETPTPTSFVDLGPNVSPETVEKWKAAAKADAG